MSKASWKKQDGVEVCVKPTKYILVTCRSTTAEENKTLSKNFSVIQVYNHELSSMDLEKMAFDLLIVDVSKKENHLFMEIALPTAGALNIAIVVLKQSMTNYQDLVKAMDAHVISSVVSLEGEDFGKFLVKTKLPRLTSRWLYFLKRLWTYVTK